MRSRLLAALLSLALPSCAWPQAALSQLRALEDSPSSSERTFDGSLTVKAAPSTGVAGGAKEASKVSDPVAESKPDKEEPPNPFRPPRPKDGDPRATAGAWKGGIIGGLLGGVVGGFLGWGLAGLVGATGFGLVAMMLGAGVAMAAAGAGIGQDVGKHCAVDPQCG